MLQLYDTLSRSIRPFEPLGPTVKLYVCGVTPYDTTHLGHAFVFSAFDVLVRYLRYLGHDVRYIQNITDIDDPLFERANAIGMPYDRLAAEQTDQYLADSEGMNMLAADAYPRASEEVPEMIELIEKLLARGRAYAVDGHVYFSQQTDPAYGELSRLTTEQLIELARERGGNPDDPLLRDPLDFLLWRPSGEGEPEMRSPFGPGLPGWHLECSAMSLKYLGAPLDIHGGGADLVFPHHESEIAQSEGATDIHPFARFWMHTAMVYMDGEKMSKSLGNMVFVRDLLQSHGANALRLYLAYTHYRRMLEYDPERLDAVAERAAELERAARRASAAGGPTLQDEPYRARFLESMNDDLDTPGAVEVLLQLAEAIEQHQGNVREAQAALHELGGILGLRLGTSNE